MTTQMFSYLQARYPLNPTMSCTYMRRPGAHPTCTGMMNSSSRRYHHFQLGRKALFTLSERASLWKEVEKQEQQEDEKEPSPTCRGTRTRPLPSVVAVDPKPCKGSIFSYAIDCLEMLIVKMMYMYDSSSPPRYLSGNFAPVPAETPPTTDLPVTGHLPECLNGEFMRVDPNPKFAPVAGYHWFDGDGMIHGICIKNGRATYVSRYVKTSRFKQEEFLGGAKFLKVGDIKGHFGLLMFIPQILRLLLMDLSYGHGTGNTSLVYHNGKLLALYESDKPYVIKILEDGDLQTLGILDYDKRLGHSFTAHPKIDPFTV
ncbi:hypothetical protein SAY87_022579 [Trapa incisa]|uniref:carotenoid 9,10-dioxygenase n=1 Tax=Trapa incisa TaxID=236973 RepID=A0AAN7K165_9MYRT|nr:hypothetical protein SAY87_022579 [Trapa incisa]